MILYRPSITLALMRSFPLSTNRLMQNCYCYTFSSIKKKADHFICAATAILTLTNPNLSEKSLQNKDTTQKNSQITQAWLDLNEPFSLREKVIHIINQLELNQSANRQEILKLFQLDQGFSLNNLKTQLTLKQSSKAKNIDQRKFVFNPTSIFKELFNFFSSDKYYNKRILKGNYGIGKTSNQLLINTLTTYVYLFRKDGMEAEKLMKQSISKNVNILKSIMNFTPQKLSKFKDEKELVQSIKNELFVIPLNLYYSLPTLQNNKSQELGFNQKDMMKYLTEQQIKRLPKKDCRSFCLQIKRICKENYILLNVVIDQSNFYFSILRKMLIAQQAIQKIQNLPSTQQNLMQKSNLRKQLYGLQNSASIYGDFFNMVAKIFENYSYITLSCSETVEFPLFHLPQQNPLRKYSMLFFNKQSSYTNYMLKYGRERKNLVWQKDMDLIFWFELENQILPESHSEDQKKKYKQVSSYLDVLNYLKYYYYNLVINGDLNFQKDSQAQKRQKQKNQKKYYWPLETRHMHIREAIQNVNAIFENIQKLKEKIIEIVSFLTYKKDKLFEKKDQRGSQILNQFEKTIRILRKEVKSTCIKRYQQQIKSLINKGQMSKITYFKILFTFELIQTLKNFEQSQEEEVFLSSQQIKKILKKIDFPSQTQIYQLINPSFTSIKYGTNITITFSKSLKQLKRYLNNQISNIQYVHFFTFLLMGSRSALAYYAQKFIIYLLTTQKQHILIKGDVNQSFNIMNKESLQYRSLLSYITIEKKIEKQLKRVIEQKSQQKVLQEQEFLKNFWNYFQKNFTEIQRHQIILTKNNNKQKQVQIPKDYILSWRKNYIQQKKSQRGSKGEILIKKGQIEKTLEGTIQIPVEKVWSHIFELLSQPQSKIQNPTLGAIPVNKLPRNEIFGKSVNSPFFDLVLIKKMKIDLDNRPFKVIGIDVTIGQTTQNYTKKLSKLIEFKNYILLNNIEFFQKIEFEVWIMCPKKTIDQASKSQTKESKSSNIWIQNFKKMEEQLDIRNSLKSTPLILKFVAFQDIEILGAQKIQAKMKFNNFLKFVESTSTQKKEKKKQKQWNSKKSL